MEADSSLVYLRKKVHVISVSALVSNKKRVFDAQMRKLSLSLLRIVISGEISSGWDCWLVDMALMIELLLVFETLFSLL